FIPNLGEPEPNRICFSRESAKARKKKSAWFWLAQVRSIPASSVPRSSAGVPQPRVDRAAQIVCLEDVSYEADKKQFITRSIHVTETVGQFQNILA
ncbi:MAG: hypothetical protein ACTSX8_02820, partial [Alphaproteobacteria bacterium]